MRTSLVLLVAAALLVGCSRRSTAPGTPELVLGPGCTVLMNGGAAPPPLAGGPGSAEPAPVHFARCADVVIWDSTWVTR